MTPYNAFTLYQSLKQHFTSDYDYFKYGGKTRISVNSFLARKDRYWFEKLSRHQDPKNFLVSNLVMNPNLYIRDALNEHGEIIYKKWMKRREALTYFFSQELKILHPIFDKNLTFQGGQQYPILLIDYIASKVSIDTVAILLQLTGAWKNWNKVLVDDVVWSDLSFMIKKYTPFIEYDAHKFRQIILDSFEVM
jgi:hypothetical protein